MALVGEHSSILTNQEGLIKDIDKDCKNKMEISVA